MTPEKQKKYDLKLKRIYDALDLKEPDMVPIDIEGGKFMINYAGYKMKDAVYDTSLEIYKEAALKFQRDFDPDTVSSCTFNHYGEGPALELVRSKNTVVAGSPGAKIDDDSIHQHIEFPTLLDDEYDEYWSDRTGWTLKKLLPRVSDTFKPFEKFDLPANSRGIYTLADFLSKPETRQTIEDLWKLSEMFKEKNKRMAAVNKELEEEGYPALNAGSANPAFDAYSDGLRGTILSLEDLYIREDDVIRFSKEHQANILARIKNSNKDGSKNGKYVQMMLHKGIDGFMNDECYERFYWNDLHDIIKAIHSVGMVPCIFCEGAYNTRLKYLAQTEHGRTLYRFETIDMAKAKEALTGVACIGGGFPSPLLQFGTKEQVAEEAKRLLDKAMPGGGYIFRCSAGIDGSKPENLETLFKTVREYGRYR